VSCAESAAPRTHSGGAAAKADEADIVLGWRAAAPFRVAQARRGGERSAAQCLVRAEPDARALAVRPGLEARVRAVGRRGPLGDIAPAPAARRALMGRRLPLDFAGQTPSGPAAPRVGLVPADVQRRLGRLGFGTKVNGKFDDSTRDAIARWQEDHGYPKTGFLSPVQHDALLGESASTTETGKSDHRHGGSRVRHSRSVGGPLGVIGSAVGGLFRR